MAVLLTIGDFSKMTYLSVKALRHYHDVGLLAPAAVDPSTGYRLYAPEQVATAQAIRRFRDLDMPIEDLRTVLQASDEATRNRAILRHLERMQRQLERTQVSVASLQSLLGGGADRTADVEIRRLPATRAIALRQQVSFEHCGPWLESALADLHASITAAGAEVTDVDGALYSDAFFENGVGEVTGFVPVSGTAPEIMDLPPSTVAVLLHEGPFPDLDQTYGALGTAVAERGIGGPGPIREHYLTSTTTEVCWPVMTTLDR